MKLWKKAENLIGYVIMNVLCIWDYSLDFRSIFLCDNKSYINIKEYM